MNGFAMGIFYTEKAAKHRVSMRLSYKSQYWETIGKSWELSNGCFQSIQKFVVYIPLSE